MKPSENTLETLESQLRGRPDSLLFARVADGYLQGGDTQRAVGLCIDGLRRYPNYTTARLVLGRCYLQQGQYAEAATEFRRVCRLDRRNPAALKLLADVLARQRATDRAGAIYNYLLESDPDNFDLLNLAANMPSGAVGHILEIAGVNGPQPAPAVRAAPEARSAEVLAAAPVEALEAPDSVATRSLDDTSITQMQSSISAPPSPSAPDRPSAAEDDSRIAELIENAETIAISPRGEVGMDGTGDLTGQDISSRIDVLFADEELPAQPAAAPEGGMDFAETSAIAVEQPPAAGLEETSILDTGRYSLRDALTEQMDLSYGVDDTVAGEAPAAPEQPQPEAGYPLRDRDESPIPDLSELATVAEVPLAAMSSPEPDEHGSGLSGTDVSARLDEMFEFASNDTDSYRVQRPQPAAAAPEVQPQVFSEADTIADTPIDETVSDTVESLLGEEREPPPPVAEARADTGMFSDKTTALDTAIIEDAMAEAAADETLPEVFEVSTPPLPQPDTPQQLAQPGDTADAFAPAPEPSRFSLAADVIAPREEPGMSLDQELTIASDDQQAVQDMMASPLPLEEARHARDDVGTEAISAEEIRTAQLPVDALPGDPTRAAADIASEVLGGAAASVADVGQPQLPEEPPVFEARREPLGLAAREQDIEQGQTVRFSRDELGRMSGQPPQKPQLKPLGDDTQQVAFQEIRLEEPSSPVALRPEASARADAGPTESISRDALAPGASPRSPARVAPPSVPARPAAPPPRSLAPEIEEKDPFAAYAHEISQAQTIQFRREDLDRFSGSGDHAQREEKEELAEQISKAQTVEFSRQDMEAMRRGAMAAPRAAGAKIPVPAPRPAPPAAKTPPPDSDDIFLDTRADVEPSTVVLDANATREAEDDLTSTATVSLADVTQLMLPAEPPSAAPPAKQSETQAFAPPPQATPFLDDDTDVASPEEATRLRSGPGAAAGTSADAVIMDQTQSLPTADLVWEEEPAPAVGAQLVFQTPPSLPQRAPALDQPGETDTVRMDAPAMQSDELDRTERMDPAALKATQLKPDRSEKPEQAEAEIAAIPDHVLTPTLADIYYHQGQPQLALHIFRRLLQLHPDNARIASRLADIEAGLAVQAAAEPVAASAPPPRAAATPPTPKPRATGARRRRRPSAKAPLSGVRIKREFREKHYRKKNRKS